MKKVCSLSLAVCLLLSCFGCDNGRQEEIYSQAMGGSSSPESGQASEDGEGTAGEKRTLTLRTIIGDMDHPVGAAPMAKQYMELHPDVEIVIPESHSGEEMVNNGDFYNQYVENLVVDLMSGEAADLVVDVGVLTPRKYVEAGVLYDIGQWMKDDPDFHEEDYYWNVFQSYQYDGQLVGVPLSFVAKSIWFNKNLVGELEYEPWELLDYKQVMKLYDRAAENHTLPENFTMTYGDMRSKYSMFAEVELPAYLDPVANTARFDSPEFIHYLKESKRIPTQLPAGQTNSMTGRGVVEMFSESIREEGDTSLLLYSTVGMGEVGELMEEYDNVAGPYFLKSTQGNIPFLPLDILLVPKTCSDPELAWDFIKFCIAPVETPAMAYVWEPEGGIDMTPLTNVPMAKQNLEQWGQLYEKMYLTESERNVDFDAMEDPLPAEVFQRFDQVLSQCSGQQDLPFGLNVNVLDLLWQYYDTDTLSAEDCARQIQERAEIWLQE